MKRIRSKLNSSQGVSIIIALVFMLICMFVGGIVLTSATVNAGRMKNIERNKMFMDHRSAAMLLADKLRTKDGEALKLEFIVTKTSEHDVLISPKGQVVVKPENAKSDTSIEYTFKLSHDIRDTTVVSPLQKIVVDSAIKFLIAHEGINTELDNCNIEINGNKIKARNYEFTPNDFQTDKDNNFIKFFLKGNLVATDGKTGLSEPITISCGRGSLHQKKNSVEDNSYDVYFMLNQEDDNKPNIDVRMYSDSPVKQVFPEVVQVVSNTHFLNQNNEGKEFRTQESVLTIVWRGPTITKGDASKYAIEKGDEPQ